MRPGGVRGTHDFNGARGAVKRVRHAYRRTGDIPVLLAAADHDGIMPGDANALELSAWQEQCGCDVSQFVLTDTGHAFMGHWSLRRWTSEVVGWLRDHGVR